VCSHGDRSYRPHPELRTQGIAAATFYQDSRFHNLVEFVRKWSPLATEIDVVAFDA
jgi:hypothetical protein